MYVGFPDEYFFSRALFACRIIYFLTEKNFLSAEKFNDNVWLAELAF
jgi:hypothetical protein